VTEAWVSCPNCGYSFCVGSLDDKMILWIPGTDFVCPQCHIDFPVEGTEFKVEDPDDYSLVRRGVFRPIGQEAGTK